MIHVAAPAVVQLQARDGVRLAVHRLGPAGGAPVVLVPGTFSNASFWIGTRGVGLARTLADHGYDTHSLDPRGHGGSDRAQRGQRWSFDQWGRADVPALIRHATTHGRPAIAIGHSAGGAAVLAALAAEPELRERVAAIIVIATPLPWLQPWRRIAARAIHAVARSVDTFPARALRLGPEDEPGSVMQQWFEWNLEQRWTGDDGFDYLQALRELRMPVLGLAGAADRRWAPAHACEALVDRLGSEQRAFRTLGRETGFSRDFGHVDIIIGRAARAEVWPLLVDWIATQGA